MWLDREIAFIGTYLKTPGRSLRFSPRFERRYLVARARKNRGSLYAMSLYFMIVMNVSGAIKMLSGAIPPDHFVKSFLVAQGSIVIPILAATAYMRRFPRSMIHYDKILALECFCGAIGLVLFNTGLPFPVSLYQAFTLPLLPIAFNMLIGMRFVYAVPLALYYLGLFLAANLMRSEFPPEARFFLVLNLVFPTCGSLIANYRVERAERVNFLRLWRDNLQGSEIKRVNRRLDALSRTDGLTGLVNRREFDARFAAEVARAGVNDKPLTLMVLDVDNFKLYNDRLGHPQGDKCLRAVALAIAEAVGPAPHFVGRIGGEEFAAVLPDAAMGTGGAAAQKIRGAVAALQWPHPALGERGIVSLSVGVAVFNPSRPETPDSLMARADAALYRAKRAGRDRAEVDLRAA